jgi:hypothetical protein
MTTAHGELREFRCGGLLGRAFRPFDPEFLVRGAGFGGGV